MLRSYQPTGFSYIQNMPVWLTKTNAKILQEVATLRTRSFGSSSYSAVLGFPFRLFLFEDIQNERALNYTTKSIPWYVREKAVKKIKVVLTHQDDKYKEARTYSPHRFFTNTRNFIGGESVKQLIPILPLGRIEKLTAWVSDSYQFVFGWT